MATISYNPQLPSDVELAVVIGAIASGIVGRLDLPGVSGGQESLVETGAD